MMESVQIVKNVLTNVQPVLQKILAQLALMEDLELQTVIVIMELMKMKMEIVNNVLIIV